MSLCDVPMREVERRGVLIDICPECRGVWLDRGELNRLLEQADAWDEEWKREERAVRSDPVPYGAHRAHQPKKRRKSVWRELFDFDLFD